MAKPDLIAGVSRDTLIRALLLIRFRRTPSGMCRIRGTLPPFLANPLVRALDRVEEDLLQIDLEGGQGAMDRTSEQRRADALLELVIRVDGIS
jgi:hypothetical protein